MDFGSSCLVGQKVCDLSSVSLSGLSLDVGGGSSRSGCWEGKEGGMGGHSFKCWEEGRGGGSRGRGSQL